MTGPDFILIGAMKCGTTTLAAQLGAQSGIFMTDPKEPNYFSDDPIYAQGPDWYAGLFEGAAPGDICGEASTHYTKRPEYPETLPRMTATLPKVRLIYMIRNPIERMISHYIHAWSEGTLSTPLENAIKTHTPLIDYGRYGWQIAPFIDAFGKNAVLLTSLERLKANPDEELKRIASHIGHEDPVTWAATQTAENVSSKRMRKLPLHGLLVDNPLATFLRRSLVPKALRTRVRAARQMTERPEMPATARAELETRFSEDRIMLAKLFPGDPSLDLAYPFFQGNL